MSFLFENNAVSTLLSNFNIGESTITVQAGQGARFPDPQSGDRFLVTLQDASNNIEICECTARVGDALTVTRAQEGTVERNWLAGDVVEARLTAQILSTYRQGVGDEVQSTAVSRAVGIADVHDIIEVTAAATITLADAATLKKGFQITIRNSSATSQVTIARATGTDTIDGVQSNFILGAGHSVYISTNALVDGFLTSFNTQNRMWPVGSIYQSAVADNPQDTLGFGTWTQIEGRFLVGVGDNGDGKAYLPGETGGQKNAIIPNHTHPLNDPGHGHNLRGGGNDDDGGARPPGGNNDSRMPNAILNSTTGITMSNPTNGESVTNKNLPPYLAVYVWRRDS